MPGFSDPRYLQTVIEALRRDVDLLKKQTLPFTAYAKGPIPNWINAVQLGPGPMAKSAMHLNMDANAVGVGPRGTVAAAVAGVLGASLYVPYGAHVGICTESVTWTPPVAGTMLSCRCSVLCRIAEPTNNDTPMSAHMAKT